MQTWRSVLCLRPHFHTVDLSLDLDFDVALTKVHCARTWKTLAERRLSLFGQRVLRD